LSAEEGPFAMEPRFDPNDSTTLLLAVSLASQI
jgi:hypothetical protein